MTRDEFNQSVKAQCRNCAANIPVRFRPETREWVHDKHISHGARFAHSLCGANETRNLHTEFADNG